ncbi:MAG: efflux RND transporter permease subunit [Spirochaetales bacterium]|nr:efflux RND transporter permease subunit [Spirochaetales bacterium]
MRHRSPRVTAIVCVCAILAAAGSARLELGNPSTAGQRWISVEIEHFGVDPLEIERTITVPLEDRVGALAGVSGIQSISDFGRSRVEILVAPGADFETMFLAARDAIIAVYATLPGSVQRPRMYRSRADALTTVLLAVQGRELTPEEVRRRVEHELRPQLEGLADVGNVQVIGGRQREIHVELDHDRVTAAGHTPISLAQEVQSHHLRVPLGVTRLGGIERPVGLDAWFEDASDLRTLLVPSQSGPIRLEALATVEQDNRAPTTIGRLGTVELVFVAISAASNGNQLRLSQQVEGLVPQFDRSSPDLSVEIITDRGGELRRDLRLALLAFGIAFAAVVAVLPFVVRSVRSALLLGASLLPKLLLLLGILGWAGNNLNTALLAGVTIGAGLLLDPSITLLARPPGTDGRGLFAPILAGGATTILALSPLVVILESVPGASELAAGISVSVVASVVVALSLTSRTRPTSTIHEDRTLKRTRLLDRLERRSTIITSCWFVVTIAGTLLGLGLPIEMAERGDRNILEGTFDMPSGTSVAAVDESLQRFARRLQALPGIESVQTTARRDSGSFIVRHALQAAQARANVLSTAVAFPDALVVPRTAQTGARLSATITLTGPDLAQLERITRELAQHAGRQPWAQRVLLNFKAPAREFQIEPDRAALNRVGLTIRDFAATLRQLIHGPVVVEWRDGDTDIDLRVFDTSTASFDRTALEQLRIATSAGALPILDIASVTETQSVSRIYRTARQRSLAFTVEADHGDVILLIEQIEAALTAVPLPEGYGWQIDRRLQAAIDQNTEGIVAIVGAALLVLCVLVVQYESVTRSLATAAGLPVVLAPTFILMRIVGVAATPGVLVGLVMAIGLAVNNMILVLSETEADAVTTASIRNAALHRWDAMVASTLTTVIAAVAMFAVDPGSEYSAVGWIVATTVAMSALYVVCLPALHRTVQNIRDRLGES